MNLTYTMMSHRTLDFEFKPPCLINELCFFIISRYFVINKPSNTRYIPSGNPSRTYSIREFHRHTITVRVMIEDYKI